jgi:hypothetical protein
LVNGFGRLCANGIEKGEEIILFERDKKCFSIRLIFRTLLRSLGSNTPPLAAYVLKNLLYIDTPLLAAG